MVGFRDDRGLLQVPRTPFRAGDHVYKATGNLIKDVIGLKENTDTGAYLGLLFGHDIRVEVDINAMVQKHVSILAKTGGGKSFLCGDLIEELMKHEVTILVFDPHGEYGAMREKGSSAKNHREFQRHSARICRAHPGVRHGHRLSTRRRNRSSSLWPISTRGSCSALTTSRTARHS